MQKKEVNWSLTLRAALILAAVGLGCTGVLQANQLCASVQWREAIKSFFALFGLFAAFGYAIGWTLPDKRIDEAGSSVNWNTRRGFWEGSLGAATLISAGVVATDFIR